MSVSFGGTNSTVLRNGYPSRVRLPGETEDALDPREVNLSNMNAAAFLRFLGIDPGSEQGLCGEITVPEARRAIIRARATGDRKVGGFTRESRSYGNLVVDGVVQLGVPRVHEQGIDESYFKRTLARFEVLVEAVAELGATHISWG